jgi:protein-L-isoaspartate O-methyltransferase
MVDTQVRPSDVTKYPVIAAMLAVPREAFVHDAQREAAYMGENIGGEYENRTHVHGFAIRCVTTPPTRQSLGRSILGL